MNLRRFLLIVILVGGFWYVTTHMGPGFMPSFQPSLGHFSLTGSGSNSPLQLTEAHAAPGYDAEEQNNIAVYKQVLPSVVNITSTTMVFDFFYGEVPQQGQGSGFILDKAGHVLTNYHVVEGANRGIKVMLSNKRSYRPSVVGYRQGARSGAAANRRARICSRSRWPTPPICRWGKRSTPSVIPSALAEP